MPNTLGIDPLHYALVVIVNLEIGLITPPVGVTLFVTSGIANVGLGRLYKAILPFLFAEIAVLFLITYVPGLIIYSKIAGLLKTKI